jgi:hypothetical protein
MIGFAGTEYRGIVGDFRSDSWDGRRSRLWSSPGSACNRSREGEGRMDFGAVDVGRGNLDAASRGMPLAGRIVVLGWLSIF